MPSYSHRTDSRSGYQARSSDNGARFERPEGELGWFKGSLVAAFGLLGVAAFAAALVGLRPEPASGLGHSATIANAGESK